MTEMNPTIKSWKTYNPAKTLVWNIIQMPKCTKCNTRYGTEAWNDNENIKNGKPRSNAPIERIRYGLTCYYCPKCAKTLKG